MTLRYVSSFSGEVRLHYSSPKQIELFSKVQTQHFKLQTMRYFLICTFAAHAFFVLAQTPLEGVINAYAAVTEIDYCTGTLTVEESNGFSVGMQIIIMQMKGASINTGNSGDFGNITDLGKAGLYERNRIQAIQDNKIILDYRLLNEYDVKNVIQIISFPVYDNAITKNVLTCQPWNGKTGGILALEVKGTLLLNASLDVSGKGFRGGAGGINASNDCNFLSNPNDYSYGLGNWRGAAKGEGVAMVVNGKEAGRGAQANGGGGGNDHNAGGGGGAHLKAGGKGGKNHEPESFGCDGDHPGIGGKAINKTGNRLFLGGGGGAGHDNNKQETSGGNGGGIILLIAKNITGSDQKIMANGATPTTISGDGAGGGGAGGTIFLQAETVSNSIEIEAKGGNGGGIDNQNQRRCHGPGGGGSGGTLLVINRLPVYRNLSGGAAGLSTQSQSCGEGINGAEAGENGLAEQFADSIPQGHLSNRAPAILSQPGDTVVCVYRPLTLAVETEGASPVYEWQVDEGDGRGFRTITSDGIIYEDADTDHLLIRSVQPEMNNYRYRLIIGGDECYLEIQSKPIQISIPTEPIAYFNYTIVNDTFYFINTSRQATSYLWYFGDGQTSTAANPTHRFAQEGLYTVTLTVTNACYTATFVQNISFYTFPNADFTAKSVTGCEPLTVTFENNSSTNVSQFTWLLPGANPNFTLDKNPTVTYYTPGQYPVTLLATNPRGTDTLRKDSFIIVQAQPPVSFVASVNDLNVVIFNQTVDATSFFWEFGDGATSTDFAPSHLYQKPGNYTITLTIVNHCGTQTTTQQVAVGMVPQARLTVTRPNGCAPHLANFKDVSGTAFESRRWEFPGGNPSSSNEASPNVIYANPGQYDVYLIATGPQGSDTSVCVACVNVLPSPSPQFAYAIDSTMVSFFNFSLNAQNYFWTFGDGETSTAPNPIHQFAKGGIYAVTLNASNAYCAHAKSLIISIDLTAVQDLRESGIVIAPNPTSRSVWIHAETMAHLEYRVFDAMGQFLKTGTVRGKTEVDLSALSAGTYWMQLQYENRKWVAKIVKTE